MPGFYSSPVPNSVYLMGSHQSKAQQRLEQVCSSMYAELIKDFTKIMETKGCFKIWDYSRYIVGVCNARVPIVHWTTQEYIMNFGTDPNAANKDCIKCGYALFTGAEKGRFFCPLW